MGKSAFVNFPHFPRGYLSLRTAASQHLFCCLIWCCARLMETNQRLRNWTEKKEPRRNQHPIFFYVQKSNLRTVFLHKQYSFVIRKVLLIIYLKLLFEKVFIYKICVCSISSSENFSLSKYLIFKSRFLFVRIENRQILTGSTLDAAIFQVFVLFYLSASKVSLNI